jgi:hypothetical protein
MTPRHPPRALGGLTTPTRPPPSREPEGSGRREDRVRRDANLPSVPRPATSCDGAGRPFLRLRVDASPPSTRRYDVSPRVRREIVSCHYHADSRIRDACVTDDRIVKDAIGADDGSRPGCPPAWTLLGPHLAADQGARQREALPRPALSRSGERRDRNRDPDPSPAPAIPGGRRPVQSLVRRESEGKAAVCEAEEPRWGAGGGPPGGGTVPTSISLTRGRADRGVESSLERR